MLEPGVIHLEAHFSYAKGLVFYDSSMITAEQIAKLLTEKTPFPATVVADQQVLAK